MTRHDGLRAGLAGHSAGVRGRIGVGAGAGDSRAGVLRRPRQGGHHDGDVGGGRLAAGEPVDARAVRLDPGRLLYGHDGLRGHQRQPEVHRRHEGHGRAEPVAAGPPPRARRRLRRCGDLRAALPAGQEQGDAGALARLVQLPPHAALRRPARLGRRHREPRTGLVRRPVHGAAGDGGASAPRRATAATSTLRTGSGGRPPTICTTARNTSTTATAATSSNANQTAGRCSGAAATVG